MRCFYRFGIHRRITLIAARTWDVRYACVACAVDTQWAGSHTRHQTQWHRHSCAKCAACASPMRHWYAVGTQHMRNSSSGDVPPNHLGEVAAYLFIFSYAVRAQWRRRPVEQGHYIAPGYPLSNGHLIYGIWHTVTYRGNTVICIDSPPS